MTVQISHQEAKKSANEHLRAVGSSLVAAHATSRQGVWVVSYEDPSHPDEILYGGALVVTDDGRVHNISSVPGALDDLLMDLGRSPLDPNWEREERAWHFWRGVTGRQAVRPAAENASRRPPWPDWRQRLPRTTSGT